MNTTPTTDILEEVWEAKDALSANYGHDLSAACRAMYAEQAKRPGDFVNLGKTRAKEPEGAGKAEGYGN